MNLHGIAASLANVQPVLGAAGSVALLPASPADVVSAVVASLAQHWSDLGQRGTSVPETDVTLIA